MLGIDATVNATQVMLSVLEQEIPQANLVPLLRLRNTDVEVVEAVVDRAQPGHGVRPLREVDLPPESTIAVVIRDGVGVLPERRDGARSRRRGRRADPQHARAAPAQPVLPSDKARHGPSRRAPTPSLLPLGHELRPAGEALALQVLVEQVVAGRARLGRLAAQRHARLVGRAATLAVVARAAGADQVVPACGGRRGGAARRGPASDRACACRSTGRRGDRGRRSRGGSGARAAAAA